jgi:hypothetical protein
MDAAFAGATKYRRSITGNFGAVGSLILVLAMLPALSRTPVVAAGPMAPRIADYRIEAAFDPDARAITGHEVLHWRNATNEPAAELHFHLYLNAFAGNRTSLMKSSAANAEAWAARSAGQWGGIEVIRVRLGNTDVTARLGFVQPDDGNPDDRTVARLPLDPPLGPGEEIDVEMDFVAHLPRFFLATGHVAPFFVVAQWYPKIGVFEHGAWNCHQYDAATVSYADFGAYDVRLRVPNGFVVGHTGVLVEERDNRDGSRTIEARAEDVHDFAWVADPRFRVVEREIMGTKVRLLLQPNHLRQSRRYLDVLRATIARYRRSFGPYPYPVVTVVDPGPGASGAEAIGYPMLYTAATSWWMPARVRLPESRIVHGFGHQYWSGMIANDECAAAWLDEGVNAYVEGYLMDALYGSGASYLQLPGLRLDATAKHRFVYLAAKTQDPITRAACAVLDAVSYAAINTGKAALVLETLERRVGRQRLLDALGVYFRQWRFRHPTGADFRASLRTSLGGDIEPFLSTVLDGTGVLDYAVTRLHVREVPFAAGRGVALQEDDRQPAQTYYRTDVIVERLGEIQTPVEVAVTFEDGTQTREVWDGRDRWRRIELVSTQRADHAEVDPDQHLPLDVDLLNNTHMRAAATRGVIRLAGRAGLWLQQVLHLLTAF